MNALDSLLADIRAAHSGQKVARRPAACPQGQAPRPAPSRHPKTAQPAAAIKPASRAATPVDNPIIARALAVLHAEFGKTGS